MSMTVTMTLSAAQQRWLEAEVAAGRYASIEAAVQFAIENLLPGNLDDLDWAAPYLDEARAGAASGEVRSIDAVRRQLAKRISDLETP